MTKEEIKELAEKIVLGIASEEEIIQYNRICDFAETTASSDIIISAAEKEELEDASKKAIFQKAAIGKVYRMDWLKRIVVAASVILVIGLSWLLFVNDKSEMPIVRNTERKTDSVTLVVQHKVNSTGKEERIQLADGSLIVLAPKSEITYREPFTASRDIALTGKAYFKVAKDKTKPFTVTSGDIATTALGTEFTITAFKNVRQIVVRLYEGKVVVKAIDKGNKRMKNDVYLLPGQEFVYGSQINTKVETFEMNRDAAPEQIMNDEMPRDNLIIPQNVVGTWYMFNNQSLGQVLDQLSQMFNVQIIYDQKDVQNIYFTRKYKRTDSLESILKEIGTIHHLTITKKDDAFIISR